MFSPLKVLYLNLCILWDRDCEHNEGATEIGFGPFVLTNNKLRVKDHNGNSTHHSDLKLTLRARSV